MFKSFDQAIRLVIKVYPKEIIKSYTPNFSSLYFTVEQIGEIAE